MAELCPNSTKTINKRSKKLNEPHQKKKPPQTNKQKKHSQAYHDAIAKNRDKEKRQK